jgi:hypothetical protein
MIEINRNNIGSIKFSINNELQNICAIYYKNLLIWTNGSSLKSCFASGVWMDEYPWTDEKPWKDSK